MRAPVVAGPLVIVEKHIRCRTLAIRSAKTGSSFRVDKESSLLLKRWRGLLTELNICCLKTRKFSRQSGMGSSNTDKIVVKTTIVRLTNRKILRNGRKLFAKGDLLLQKRAFRFKLRS